MDQPARPVVASVPNLRDAIRRARLADADRAAAVAELHEAEIARLDLLAEALGPVLAQVPEGVELFDHGLVPGEPPRLHIDILAFVEMARDRRQYRLLQDTRWGRRTLIESDSIPAVVEAVTDYIALRLVERAKALAADGTAPIAAPKIVPRAEPARAPALPGEVVFGPGPRVAMVLWFLAGLVIGAVGLYAAHIPALSPFR